MHADGTEATRVSPEHHHAATCPRCSTHHEVETWTFVDARRHPHQRERILSHSINMFVCSVCTITVRVELPLLYVDTINGFSAFHVPSEALSDTAWLRRFDTRGRLTEPLNVRTSAMGGMIVVDPHVVFSIAELVRYIEFREALAMLRVDDRRDGDAEGRTGNA